MDTCGVVCSKAFFKLDERSEELKKAASKKDLFFYEAGSVGNQTGLKRRRRWNPLREISSCDECISRIAEDEVKKRGQARDRRPFIDDYYRWNINWKEKTNVVILFCNRFLLLGGEFYFYDIFTIFSRSTGKRGGRLSALKRRIEGGGTSRESKRKVALSLSFATAFGQRISRLRRGGESRSEPR